MPAYGFKLSCASNFLDSKVKAELTINGAVGKLYIFRTDIFGRPALEKTFDNLQCIANQASGLAFCQGQKLTDVSVSKTYSSRLTIENGQPVLKTKINEIQFDWHEPQEEGDGFLFLPKYCDVL